MSDTIAYAVVALLLVQALLRSRSALRGDVRERSLWGAFAALAASWLSRTQPGRELVNSFGVTDLAYLVKHTLAIIGICVLLRYVTAVYRDADTASEVSRNIRVAATVHRIATRASLGTVALMTAVFFTGLSTPDPGASDHLMARHAGEPGLAVYMGLFYLYTASAAAVCAVQWGGARRHAPMRPLRIGLTMMSAGMVLLVGYALLRTAYVVLITITPVSEATAALQETVSDSMLYAGFLLYGIGAIAPAAYAANARYHTARSLSDLHTLWRDLALTAPDHVRHRPSRILGDTRIGAPLRRLRDITGHGESLSQHLHRFVTEIRDVIHELRRHAPEELAERALLRAEHDENLGEDTEIRAEAYWIRAARSTLGATPGLPAPFPFHPGTDLSDEIPHLRAVAAAYSRTSTRDAYSLLADPSAVTA
ncbi:MAB_1171c family putative transporter [Streptomyces yaizuensis]|uniref:DUF2304 domain-containing protein n=1 Tax=Streptomyces yaizuensis TaxID=2989713 RepID=A0ABQ5P691_9ACTN|nr:MAB_1171c family putative transporter [Streptomyces sp. YSPA8]GLF98080.1 DUF2304 domain-containing protein [Streptomyces sp. YSPA8]